MACNSPCKTVAIRATGSKVQFQFRHSTINPWINSPMPSGSSGIRVNSTPIGLFVRSRQQQAQNDANAPQQAFPPFEACPGHCPCVGIETKRPIAPMFTDWQDVQVEPIGFYRFRFKIDREIIFIEGICIEVPHVDDFTESQYAAAVDAPSQNAEVVLAMDMLTGSIARIETMLVGYNFRLSKLEKSSSNCDPNQVGLL